MLDGSIGIRRRVNMELWKELLSSDVGLLSLITIVLTMAVVGTCVTIFIRKVRSAPQPSE
jgi:hypothetical protein